MRPNEGTGNGNHGWGSRGEDGPAQGLCPNCDKKISITSAECPHCKATFGTDSSWKVKPLVRTTEKVLAIAKQFNLDGFSRSLGDLIFTSKRVIFVKSVGGMDIWPHLFGMIATAVAKAEATKVSNAIQKTPLDELLGSSHEKTFFPYVELSALRICPSRLFSSKVILQRQDGSKTKFWGKRRDLLAVIDVAAHLKSHGAPVEVQ